jgi:uncharacterized protein (DUF983 family)
VKLRRRRVEPEVTHVRVWGTPGPCPVCGGAPFLDRLDLIDRVSDQHCTDCGHKWSEHEDDVALLYNE